MSADDDLRTVEQALDEDGPGRVVAVIGFIRSGIVAVCAGAALTAVLALALGLVAWRNETPGLVLALAVGVVGIVAPVYVARRAAQLARALANPDQVVAQAKDLVVRAKGSPELGRLAATLRRRRGGRARGRGRVRRALSSARSVSAVIGLAQPDPVRHGLLVPFTPERLRNLWLAVTVSLWAWLVAALTAVVALAVLATHLL